MSPLPGAPPPNCLPRPCSPEDLVTPMTVVPDVGGELGSSVSHILSIDSQFRTSGWVYVSEEMFCQLCYFNLLTSITIDCWSDKVNSFCIFWKLSPLPGASSPNCPPRPCSPEDLATPRTVVLDVGGELGLSVSHILSIDAQFRTSRWVSVSEGFVISIYSQALLQIVDQTRWVYCAFSWSILECVSVA